jgi:hypothetical protein
VAARRTSSAAACAEKAGPLCHDLSYGDAKIKTSFQKAKGCA